MKLATIEKITNLTPVPNADSLSKAQVLGFQSVVKKDEFSTGELAVFIMPDTIMPADERWAFLEKYDWRVKLMKLRGVYSQGLIFPISKFPNIDPNKAVVGQDVTLEVGVTKYNKPAPKDLNAKGAFPGWLRKTDEPNLLGVPHWIEQYKGKDVVITLKMDGQSGTFFFDKGEFGVCSRNLELKDGNNTFWNMAREYQIAPKLTRFANLLKLGNKLPELPRVAIQAEVYGPGIQGNKMGAPNNAISVFNLYNGDDMEYCHYPWLKTVCEEYQLPAAEVIYEGVFDFSLEQLQELANKQVYSNGAPAEGIVIRPVMEERTPEGERLSAKVISEKYMAKHGE